MSNKGDLCNSVITCNFAYMLLFNFIYVQKDEYVTKCIKQEQISLFFEKNETIFTKL